MESGSLFLQEDEMKIVEFTKMLLKKKKKVVNGVKIRDFIAKSSLNSVIIELSWELNSTLK